MASDHVPMCMQLHMSAHTHQPLCTHKKHPGLPCRQSILPPVLPLKVGNDFIAPHAQQGVKPGIAAVLKKLALQNMVHALQEVVRVNATMVHLHTYTSIWVCMSAVVYIYTRASKKKDRRKRGHAEGIWIRKSCNIRSSDRMLVCMHASMCNCIPCDDMQPT